MTAGSVVGTAPAPPFDCNATGDGAPSVGLSYGHISPCQYPRQPLPPYAAVPEYRLKLARGSRLVKVEATSPASYQSRHWARGRVGGFSRKSQSRLIQLLNSIVVTSERKRPLFLTLTMPGNWTGSHAQAKRYLDSLWKRLKRGWWQPDNRGSVEYVTCNQAAAVWRLELQERGAPHFHILIFGCRWIDRKVISRMWREVVGDGGDDHEKAGTNIQRDDYWGKAGNYLAKYVSKQAAGTRVSPYFAPDTPNHEAQSEALGRSWGVLGRANLPMDLEHYEIPEEVFGQIKELLIAMRDDSRMEEWRRAPYRGLWGTCGPGPVDPILAAANLRN